MTDIDEAWGRDAHTLGATWTDRGTTQVWLTAWSGPKKKGATSTTKGAGLGYVSVQNPGIYDVYIDNPIDQTTGKKKTATTASESARAIFGERIPLRPPDVRGNLQPLAALADQFRFDLLVPEGKFVGHYVRQGTNGGWERVDKLLLPDGQQIPDTAVSHIQSFRAPDHLNALTWIQPSNTLVAFEYKPDSDSHEAIPVDAATGEFSDVPALVQTDQGLFHLLVPLPLDPDGAQLIIHQIHTNETIQGPWKTGATLPSLGPGVRVISIALVQADGYGSLKAVVRVRPFEGSDFLVSYQSDPNYNWQGPFPVSTAVIIGPGVSTFPHEQDTIENNPGAPGHESSFALTPLHTPDTISNVAGSPGLAQSIFGDQEQLDLIVPIADPQTGTITLTQFTQPAGFEVSINQPWKRAATLQPLNNDAHTQVVSTSIIQDSHRDLQNIAHVMTPRGENLLAFYIFNPKTGWSKPAPVTKPNGKPIIVGHDNGPSDENGDNSDDHDDNGHENGHENGDPDHTPDS